MKCRRCGKELAVTENGWTINYKEKPIWWSFCLEHTPNPPWSGFPEQQSPYEKQVEYRDSCRDDEYHIETYDLNT